MGIDEVRLFLKNKGLNLEECMVGELSGDGFNPKMSLQQWLNKEKISPEKQMPENQNGKAMQSDAELAVLTAFVEWFNSKSGAVCLPCKKDVRDFFKDTAT